MEVLKSSQVLESEIRADAQNKAKRILDAAEKDVAQVGAEWAQKYLEETQRLDEAQHARRAALRQELEASLPLDFMRIRLSFILEAVTAALKEQFDTLSAAELSRLIGMLVKRAAYAFKGARVVVWYAGMKEEEAQKIVKESIPGATVAEARPLGAEEAAKAGKGIVLETVDRSRRYRATLAEMESFLLENYREELVVALLGKDVLK
jgi:V/A-type H+/Na+-transporting ATPase subunit E